MEHGYEYTVDTFAMFISCNVQIHNKNKLVC